MTAVFFVHLVGKASASGCKTFCLGYRHPPTDRGFMLLNFTLRLFKKKKYEELFAKVTYLKRAPDFSRGNECATGRSGRENTTGR